MGEFQHISGLASSSSDTPLLKFGIIEGFDESRQMRCVRGILSSFLALEFDKWEIISHKYSLEGTLSEKDSPKATVLDKEDEPPMSKIRLSIESLIYANYHLSWLTNVCACKGQNLEFRPDKVYSATESP